AAGVLITVLLLTSGDRATPGQAGNPPGGNNPGQPVNQPHGPRITMEGPEAYKKALPSTVWILTRKGSGTGSLVDVAKRVVVTNAHVVPLVPDGFGVLQDEPPTVHFPMFKEGKVVAEKDYYSRFPQGAIVGKVIYRDVTRDLAIIKLNELPATIPAL